MHRDWPLVGRSDELRLSAEFGRRTGRTAGIVLAGQAGVGKTRLAREMLDVATRRGVSARWVVGTESGRGLPFGAFGSAIGDVGAGQIGQIGRATAALLSDAPPSGLVLGIDDGHLLDEQSALVVHHVVTRRLATVVVTVRSGEPAPDAVTALWKDDYLPRREIGPLSAVQTADLMELALGGPVHSATVNRFWSITQGNPFYLRNLVDGQLEAGHLHTVGGLWQWTSEVSMPPGLVELIKDRVGSLSDTEREVADLLAFGEPIGIDLLVRHTDPGAAERLETRRLVEVTEDGRRREARLAHPLYGELLRATSGLLRARRIRGRLAAMLAATGGRRADDLLRRAALAIDSDLVPDPQLFTAAAGRAAALVDHRLAETLARAAVSAGGGFAPRLILANALTGRGDVADTEIADLERSATTDDERLQATLLRVLDLAWMQGRPAEAEAALDSAEAAGIPDPGGDLRAVRAQFDIGMGRVEKAAAAADAVLAGRAPSDLAVVCASWAASAASGMSGRTAALSEVAERGRSVAATLPGGAWWGVSIAGRLVDSLVLAGRLSEARTVASEIAEQYPDADIGGSIGRTLCGQVDSAAGSIEPAVRLLLEGRSGFTVLGGAVGGWLGVSHLLAVLALAVSQKHWPTARQAMLDAEANQHPTTRLLFPVADLALAWVAAADGAVSEAAQRARKSADDALSHGQYACAVVALHDAVRFGDGTVATRLADLAARVEGPRASAAAAHAAAFAGQDGDGLLAASAALQDMGALLHAADAAAQAHAAHAAAGRRGSAATAAERARELLARCPDARTPATIALQQPLPLTTREREIATLAAGGMSNQDIAARLQVSVRTVEGHLYNAYRKLGTTTRAGLAAHLPSR